MIIPADPPAGRSACYDRGMELLFLLIIMVALPLLSIMFGAESRPGFDERPFGDRFGTLR